MTQEAASPDPSEVIRSRRLILLLVIAGIAGLVVSSAAWGVLELVHKIQVGVFTDLPKDLGHDNGAPLWWYVVVGLNAAKLPGFPLTPAVAVGIGASVAAALRLPLAGVVLGVLLTSKSGPGTAPLIIVGAVTAYLAARFLPELPPRAGAWAS